MSAEYEELAELVADLRAALIDARLRGARALDPEAPLPEIEAPTPAASKPEPAAEAAAPHSAWEELAAEPATPRTADDPAAAMAAVREELGDCQRCPLARGRTHLVFGVGDPGADLVVVGEAPGYHEDQRGEPFVGKAGKMLDAMLENVLGLRRDQVWICNVVKCRPPDNRNPTPEEVEACLPFLEKQLLAAEPKVVLVLGSVAYKSLFRTRGGITRARGGWKDLRGVPVMPTFHPAYLLRNPAGKRDTFADLKALRARYDELGGRR